MQKLIRMLLIGIILISGFNCSSPESDRMPITTASEKAREYYLQGLELSDNLRGQEAVYFYLQALALDPDFALANLNMAYSQPSIKGFFKYFNRARNLVDQVSEGERLWILGVEAGVNGFPMEQRKLYEKMVTNFPWDVRARNILANHYFAQHDYMLAIEEYNRVIEIDPGYAPPYNQLGYCYRYLGNYNEAEKAFKKYIELIRDEPNPYDSYAEFLLKKGDFNASIDYYQKALAINPNFVPSHRGIATNLVLQEKHTDARKQLQELYDMALNNGQRRTALFGKAITYIDEGNFNQAFKELNLRYLIADIIEDVAAMANDLHQMSNILLEIGKVDKAIEKCTKALELVENSELPQEIKNNTKLTFMFTETRVDLINGDLVAAKTKSKQFLQQAESNENPNQIRTAHELSGLIALSEEDFDTAVEEFAKADQLDPYNLFRLAQAYEGQGNFTKAKEFYAKAAHFNLFYNLNYAFVRNRALKKLDSM